MKKGKYLITGCAGFIGSHLTKTIFKDHDLILVDDLSEGKLKNLPQKLRKSNKSYIQIISSYNLFHTSK